MAWSYGPRPGLRLRAVGALRGWSGGQSRLIGWHRALMPWRARHMGAEAGLHADGLRSAARMAAFPGAGDLHAPLYPGLLNQDHANPSLAPGAALPARGGVRDGVRRWAAGHCAVHGCSRALIRAVFQAIVR